VSNLELGPPFLRGSERSVKEMTDPRDPVPCRPSRGLEPDPALPACRPKGGIQRSARGRRGDRAPTRCQDGRGSLDSLGDAARKEARKRSLKPGSAFVPARAYDESDLRPLGETTDAAASGPAAGDPSRSGSLLPHERDATADPKVAPAEDALERERAERHAEELQWRGRIAAARTRVMEAEKLCATGSDAALSGG
jgi:hypothetical protein